MAVDISLEEAQKSLKGVTIPPRPALLTEINSELQRPHPDIKLVAARIAKDVGLSSSILKVTNSPFFGLRSKIGSVPHAIQLLGMRNVKSIVTGLMLRSTLDGQTQSLERFWDSSEKVARISAFVASTLPRAPRDEAYTFGLFRECGIPLLMQRFPEYKETLKVAPTADCPMTATEDERHGTNHAVVGYMVARVWGLPETIPEAILRHHDPAVLSDSDSASPQARTLVAINFLAEYLNDSFLRMRNNALWESVGEDTLAHLGISSGELEEIKEEVATFE